MNKRVSELIRKLIKNDKTSLYAKDYKAISELLTEAVKVNTDEYRIDTERTKRLAKGLERLGIKSENVLCYGSRKLRVIISNIDISAMKLSAEKLRRTVENFTEEKLTEPKYQIDGDEVSITFESEKHFSVESAYAASKKAGEEANGDAVELFNGRNDYYYSLISDGMGSGREAAITSKLCSSFLRKMLTGGGNIKAILEMLNGFIGSRNNEYSSTVDLAQIDLLTGKARFTKCGAAPTFIMREQSIFKIQSETLPIGILGEVDAQQTEFELNDGDVIVMFSDGIASSIENGTWLASLITYEWENKLPAMAEKIISASGKMNTNDDMSVVLMRIHRE